MMTGAWSDTIATGMKIVKAIPATIETDTTNGSLLDLRPCRHDSRAGERERAMSGVAL